MRQAAAPVKPSSGATMPIQTRQPLSTKNEKARADEHISVLVSTRVLLKDHVGPGTLVLSRLTGKIVAIYPSILPKSSCPFGSEYLDYSPYVIMPGLVDTHVHLNEPGRTDTEGFFTATQAALFGGVTTVVDMPLNSIPPTTTMAGLQAKLDAATGQCWTDIGFLGGIVPGNVGELKPMVDAGVRGFKCFLIETGVAEFDCVSYEDVRDAMLELADSPTMIMFHAELPPKAIPSFERSKGGPEFLFPSRDTVPLYVYNNFLASRPPVFEDGAIEMLIDLSHFAPNLPLHVAHVSTAEALPILRKAQEAGVNISAETCFHYLALKSEEVPLRDTRFKSEPPIRSKANQDLLWSALRKLAKGEETLIQPGKKPDKDLRRGPITAIVSDHSPCSPEAKFLPSYIPPHTKSEGFHDNALNDQSGDFFRAWGGIASVGLGLPIMWTEFRRRKWNIDDAGEDAGEDEEDRGTDDDSDAKWLALRHIVEWCCRNTAELVGLGTKKGRLEVGYDADICIFDPEADWVLTEEYLFFKHKMSPYEGRKFRGRAMATWLRGEKKWELGSGFVKGKPEGQLLMEKRRPERPDPPQQSTWMDWAHNTVLWPFSVCHA